MAKLITEEMIQEFDWDMKYCHQLDEKYYIYDDSEKVLDEIREYIRQANEYGFSIDIEELAEIVK